MERSSDYAVEEICAVFSALRWKERYENEVTWYKTVSYG